MGAYEQILDCGPGGGPNGTPDETECPIVAYIRGASPPSGAIDARKPHPSTGTTPLYVFGMPDDTNTPGVNEAELTPIVIDLGVAGLPDECFDLCDTAEAN